MDPTPEEWQGILQVVQRRKLFCFFDSAYQVGGTPTLPPGTLM